MISKKDINKVFRGMVAAMPAIPYIMRSRHRTPVAAYILGGIGVAVAGGLVALMLFSPRTRHRALNAARDTYGKVNDKISHLRPRARMRAADVPIANGLAGHEYPTSGL